MDELAIVYARPPKRQPKPKQASPDVPVRVVTDGKTKKRKRVEVVDSEADAQVAEWFKRNIQPPGR
jgi:hypothetical protein